jgi:NADPH2:quinone reductase
MGGMRAVQITQFGGPEVLTVVDLEDPVPGDGQVLVDVARSGVNYADTHHAENSYLAPATLPLVPGSEVVGHTGDGRRVLALLSSGGYAQRAVADSRTVFDVPPAVDDMTALALAIQGTTAWLLLRRSVHLAAGESVVVHAAAGGVGSLAVQLAKAWGAGRVIATASTDRKRDLARELGADATVDANAADMTAALREANGGRRVDIVLDMTGGRVTDQSIAALAPFGRLAFYGMASRELPGAVSPVNLLAHSTTVAGMWLVHAMTVPGLLQTALSELYGLVEAGQLRAVAGGDYPLTEARRAHEELRARRTVGKIVLDPSR